MTTETTTQSAANPPTRKSERCSIQLHTFPSQQSIMRGESWYGELYDRADLDTDFIEPLCVESGPFERSATAKSRDILIASLKACARELGYKHCEVWASGRAIS